MTTAEILLAISLAVSIFNPIAWAAISNNRRIAERLVVLETKMASTDMGALAIKMAEVVTLLNELRQDHRDVLAAVQRHDDIIAAAAMREERRGHA